MLGILTTDGAHYAKLSRLLWKYGRHDLAQQLGLTDGDVERDEGATAEDCARDIEQLGVAYIKLAQIASTRHDLLTPDYVDAFNRLQDDVDPVPSEEIEQIIVDSLGASPHSIFKTFDRHALATASVGQVHAAVLKDGRPVVVKVRRPGIVGEAHEQLRSLKRLAATVDGATEIGRKFRFRSLVGAVEYALNNELDYRCEADHLTQLSNNLSRFQNLRVPRPVSEWVTSDVLVMEFLQGTSIKDVEDLRLRHLETTELAEELVHAYLQQIVCDGLFHADPHPGNLLLLNDGRIGLLDGGMVVSLAPTLKRDIGALLLAFSEGEGDRASSIAIRIGQTEDGFDPKAFRASGSRVVASAKESDYASMSLGKTIIEFLNVAGEHGLVLPFEIILMCKAFLQLETTLERLDPELDLQKVIRKHAFEILGDRAQEQFGVGKIVSTALDSVDLASQLPSRLNELTRLAAENQLKLQIDAIDEKELLRGIRKIANRITSGLIVAAMIVSAAIIMHADSGVKLFGYPLLSTVFFLVAAAIALNLLYQAMVADDH